jgi:hypothetical protein
MPLTLGMTGMDPATETALKAAFSDANARLDGMWQLLPEAQAGHVMVDMDSMYGPMSWLRLHAAGKKVIGLTTAPRTQTDFRLGRPFDSASVAEVLREIAAGQGVAPAAAARQETPEPAPAAPVTAAAPESAPAPEPAQRVPAPAATAAEPPVAAEAPPPPVAIPEPPAAPRERRLADWLAPGALAGRVRLRTADGGDLLIDPIGRQYHGPASLKPLAASFERVVARTDFEDLDDAAWTRAATAPAQPLQRLQWLGALLAGGGSLLPGHDPDARYRLNKWPQTEREYPKHFRIATQMMKGPATLAEIAQGSGMPAEDVADFVNANLATGFAEAVVEATAEPVEPAKPTSLFGRLRGK